MFLSQNVNGRNITAWTKAPATQVQQETGFQGVEALRADYSLFPIFLPPLSCSRSLPLSSSCDPPNSFSCIPLMSRSCFPSSLLFLHSCLSFFCIPFYILPVFFLVYLYLFFLFLHSLIFLYSPPLLFSCCLPFPFSSRISSFFSSPLLRPLTMW